jgi:nucleoside-diphosphate-sugar epimerase
MNGGTGPLRIVVTGGRGFVGQIVQGMVSSHALDTIIVRFPGVYGEGLRGSLSVARFFERAMAGGVLGVHADGHQTRTPIHVDDLVAGLMSIVERRKLQGLLNLGTSEEISPLELARRICAIVGGGRIVHPPQRRPRTWREVVGWSRKRTILGWQPSVSLDDGFRRTWLWWREGGEAGSCAAWHGPTVAPGGV